MALMSVKLRCVGYAQVVASTTSTSLVEAKRQAAVEHILASARRLVLSSGLDVTMDQLAEVSGVSRRTLFRHFATREKLLAAAFEAGMTGYRQQLPRFDGDLRGWLRVTCDAAHRMNATIGPGFFELASRADLPPDLAAAETRRLREFRGAMSDIAQTLWRSAGADGIPPQTLTSTIAAHLSPHFTAAVIVDTGEDWQSAAAMACTAIEVALDHEIGQRAGNHEKGRRG